MNIRDLIDMECPSCKTGIYADKNADHWYCGLCGKRIDLKAAAELQEKENKLKAKEAELKIRENALKKKEAELKEKESLLKVLESGQEIVKPSAPSKPTFKAAPMAEGEVPKLNRPDTVLNNPEMKFTNLASDVNKKTEPEKKTAPVIKSEKKPEPAEPVKIAPAKPAEEKKPEPVPTPAPAPKSEPVKEKTVSEFGEDKKESKKEFEMNEHTLVKYNSTNANVSKVHIPLNVWRIGSSAFKDNKNITSVVCGDHVKEIGDSAFMDCTELTEVKLSDELKKINYKTFNGCMKLKSITIPARVEEIMCDSMVCGLEEIILENPRTTWEQTSDFADASFSIDKNGNGKGVSRIIFKGTEYKAVDVFKHGSLSNYFKSSGLCQYCGNKFSLFNGKCPVCKIKKDY
ncbi:MAG: leucine-rich repeat protein [Ruminococcus sp.]|nr:leucine-rich repeat protein [Ruminococcus sp.]